MKPRNSFCPADLADGAGDQQTVSIGVCNLSELQLGTWQFGNAAQTTANRTAPKLFQIMTVIHRSKKAVRPRRPNEIFCLKLFPLKNNLVLFFTKNPNL